jgi:hypothetical protein
VVIILNFLAAVVKNERWPFGNYIRKRSVRVVSAILSAVSRRKQKEPERPVFDSIRKPTPPPGRKFGTEKPEERVHPTLRKTKHKKRDDRDPANENV